MLEQTFEEWLRSFHLIAGADGEGDDDSADNVDTDTDTDTEDTSGSAEDDTDTEESHNDEVDEDGEDDADLDELERVRRERDDARSKLASAESAAQKAKKDARKAREEAAKKGGNWEAVAKERESELQEANERAQEAETRAVTAEESLDNFRREVRITRIASKLSFRDPEDAIKHLLSQPEATGDDKACERALRKLAEAKPYLVDQRRARGRAMAGDGNGGPGLTAEDLKTMTPEQINEAWDKGMVQPAISRSRGG